jgi:LPS export ABC transporter protein LptC
VNAPRWLSIKAQAGRVLLACLVLSVVASVFWYRRMAVDDQQQAPAPLPANDTKAEMVTRDFRHVETRMDRTIWILEAARAEIFENWVKLHTVKVTWYGEPGELPVVITSAQGDVDFRDRNAELRGNIRIERADGAVLRTEKLTWDEKARLLRAPSPVVITTPKFTFRGDSFEADLTTEQIRLRGQVRGKIQGGSLAPARPS